LNGTAADNDIDSAYLFEDDTDDTMKNISTTDSDFEQRAYENGILDSVASHPPPPTSTPSNMVSPSAAPVPSHPSTPIKHRHIRLV
jgi:hypothetical protein